MTGGGCFKSICVHLLALSHVHWSPYGLPYLSLFRMIQMFLCFVVWWSLVLEVVSDRYTCSIFLPYLSFCQFIKRTFTRRKGHEPETINKTMAQDRGRWSLIVFAFARKRIAEETLMGISLLNLPVQDFLSHLCHVPGSEPCALTGEPSHVTSWVKPSWNLIYGHPVH